MKLFTLAQPLQAACAGIIILSCFSGSNIASADTVTDAADACKEAARLILEEDDLDGAIEEADWCMTGLKQLQEEIKLSLFPDELNGYQGGDTDSQNVMGMAIVERQYTQDGKTISLTLTTTSTDAAGGLGALAELGKLFSSLEGASATASGGKKIRIQKRTVYVADEGGAGKLTIELKSSGTLRVESSDLHSDELVEFMREFPIIELDDAMEK